jgi:hypothetical protein
VDKGTRATAGEDEHPRGRPPGEPIKVDGKLVFGDCGKWAIRGGGKRMAEIRDGLLRRQRMETLGNLVRIAPGR